MGRDTELEQLCRVPQLAGDGHGQVTAIVGEVGVGKSRLVHEFTHSYSPPGLAKPSISAGDLRKQLVVNDGESDGLFCHWDDTTGMEIWRLLTAIKAAGEAVADVAYWFTSILENADQPPDDVSDPII